MKPTIVISIVDGILFPNSPDVHSRYTLHERNRKNELSTLTQIHYLELNKIDLMKPVSEMTPYERIGAYFKCVSDESKQDIIAELFQHEPEVMTMTKPILEEISMDDQMRYLEEEHENYLRDLATHHAEGLEEGLEKGENRIAQLHTLLIESKRFDDLERSCKNPDFRNSLLVEFGLK